MTTDRPSLNQIQSRLVPILLIIIAVLLCVQALRITRPVTMPIAFAFFIAVLAHPMQAWLERYVPKWLAMVGVLA
ncbi:AI-2E family transporter, partial [filamentous cyanobacterium CCT1]